ncbi:hypothetical protein MMC25_002483 [Agyrium rufum]|nr:hypothetical protein [Agyrium rufum]
MAVNSNATNAIDAQPSYNEIGKTVPQYLKELEAYGLFIERLYFDGYLPAHKREIRLQRLDAYLRQLIVFQAAHNKGLESKAIPERSEAQADKAASFSLLDVSSTKSPYHRSTPLPAPSFLVPAVLDALRSSPFAARTEVIPGEADTFCAALVKKSSGLVLTSDSDLLVHDVGPRGGVIFFDQLDVQRPDADDSAHLILYANVFRPQEIARRLQIQSIMALAFEMVIDLQSSFQQVLNCTRNRAVSNGRKSIDIEAHEQFVKEFADPYTSIRIFNNLGARCSAASKELWPLLDPRVSEMVLQCLHDSNSSDDINVFLSTLIEDTSRVSAWAPSFNIRCFAYSVLAIALGVPDKVRLSEYVRKGLRTVANKVTRGTLEQCSEFADTLLRRLGHIDRSSSENELLTGWQSFALHEALHWYHDTGRALPDRGTIGDGLGRAGSRSWDAIHLHAQCEGVMYSLRMLQQVFKVVSGRSQSIHLSRSKPIGKCQSLTERLPSLAQILPFSLNTSSVNQSLEAFRESREASDIGKSEPVNGNGAIKR